MKVSIIGCGKMGSALAFGIAKGHSVTLILNDHSFAKAKSVAAKVNGRVEKTPQGAAAESEIVIIAVKPDSVEPLLSEISPALPGKILISIAAGLPLPFFKKHVPATCSVAIAMPSLAAQIGKGAVMYYPDGTKSRGAVQKIFKPAGLLLEAKSESQMDAAFLHSSGLAFFMMAIDGMAKAGVKGGLPYGKALLLSARAAEASGAMLLDSGLLPAELESMVATKKGITEKGLAVLRKKKVGQAYFSAASAAMSEARKRRLKNR